MMLDGKNALITGSSRGIGRGIAELFAVHGAFVGINYCSDHKAARHTLEQVSKQGSDGVLLQGDVANRTEVHRIVKTFIKSRNTIDILVNNAGVYYRGGIRNVSVEQWKKVLAVNLSGCFHLVQEVLPYMSRGGRIIFISSQLAFKGSAHGADYAASKAGVLGLMRSVALELADQHILVNAVAPGTIDTDIIADYTIKQRKQRIQEIPLKRLGTAEDVAKVCLFLASDLASYITGETIHVNGGLYI